MGTGAFLPPLARFLPHLHVERLAPADSLVVSGSGDGLADPGRAYLFYLPTGGAVDLDLSAAATGGRTLDAVWIDPQNGAPTFAPAVPGGGVRTLSAPTADRDWVLWLAAPQGFFTLSPCRAVDTRAAGQGPALAAGEVRVLALSGGAGSCSVPPTARAVAVNITVTGSTAAGFLSLGPGGAPPPGSSIVNFEPGQTRANNAILPLGPDGSVAVYAGLAQGSVHLIVDLDGCFE